MPHHSALGFATPHSTLTPHRMFYHSMALRITSRCTSPLRDAPHHFAMHLTTSRCTSPLHDVPHHSTIYFATPRSLTTPSRDTPQVSRPQSSHNLNPRPTLPLCNLLTTSICDPLCHSAKPHNLNLRSTLPLHKVSQPQATTLPTSCDLNLRSTSPLCEVSQTSICDPLHHSVKSCNTNLRPMLPLRNFSHPQSMTLSSLVTSIRDTLMSCDLNPRHSHVSRPQ